MLSILKGLSFFLVAEALMGLIYHRPAGENPGFSKSAVNSLIINNICFSGKSCTVKETQFLSTNIILPFCFAARHTTNKNVRI